MRRTAEWAFLAAALLRSVSGSIEDSFFSWIPAWARDPLPAGFAETGSSTAQVVTAVGYLVVLVVAAPLVEELSGATCCHASSASAPGLR